MHTNTNPAIATLFLWFFIVAITCNFNVGFSYGSVDGGMNCIENERDALLKIKNGLKDPYGRLVSWTVGSSNDCCGWYGVVCDNSTGHVLQLHLRGLRNYYLESSTVFGGKISQSLLNLTHLTYLDLSHNRFDGIQIPKFLGTMESLTYLDLSHAGFGHPIPPQLGNLTNLIHLDISKGDSYSSDDVHWLSGLSSLQFLDLSGRNLSQNLNWFQVIPKLHFLQELYLFGCQLPSPPSILNLNSSSSLVVLNLSGNYLSKSIVSWISHLKHLKSLNLAYNFFLGFNNLHEFRNLSTSLIQLDLTSIGFNSLIPNWLYDFSNLELLNLSYNDLQGQISDVIVNMTSLITLDLSGNSKLMREGIPASFQKLCNLRTLSLWNVNLSQDINKVFENLIGCGSNDLESLILGSDPSLIPYRNSIFGEIPMSLGEFHSLRYLDLSYNKLNGTIPESFGRLSNLKRIDISHNSMEGDVSEIHFANLSSLLVFSANGNKLNLKVGLNWIPPPQLEVLGLRSWNVGPQIPALLPSLKNLIELDLSNSRISTSSLPVWFWRLTSQLTYLNISHNNIQGVLPNRLKFPEYTDLSSNNFQGSLPLVSSYHIVVLDLSNNFFSGSISNFLCRRTTDSLGGVLNLEKNLLEGEIPNCWNKLPKLVVLRLSHNKFNGSIPASIGSLYMLKSLHLCNNSLSGEVPLSLENCTRLVTFDVSENKLEGNIPRWIGEKLLDLIILDMRTNSFVGSIPPEICHAHNLHILYLANNNLSGTIPTCLSNFSVMANMNPSSYPSIFLGSGGGEITTFVIDSVEIQNKGLNSEYNTILRLVKTVDLSNNRLYGEIPKEITSLKALMSLNLSHNYLSGRIPKYIGSMTWLESIDLSSNKLSGEIPPSISSLTFLSHLNLSHNKLSGRIPSSTQIQSFDSSCFIGNIELCGKPLADSCSNDGVVIIPSSKENMEESDNHGFEMVWFYATVAIGFIVGFWGMVGPLIFNRNWRLTYFQFLQRMEDKIYIWWHLL